MNNSFLKNNAPLRYRLKRRRGASFYYDPLYGHIPLSPFFRHLLDLPELQRLRGLKQNGILRLVFPGATHTRFEHSVGVYYLTGIVFDRLREKAKYKDNWPKLTYYHKEALQIAALLHDVGHEPFSHTFEKLCNKLGAKEYRHELATKKLITNGIRENNHIPETLRKHKKEKEKKIEEDYQKLFIPESIAYIAAREKGEGPPPEPPHEDLLFLAQIVDYVFDANRMDYLRRDAFHTGIEIGRVDIWEIINNFTLHKDQDINLWTIKYKKTAAKALEGFLKSRDFAYRHCLQATH